MILHFFPQDPAFCERWLRCLEKQTGHLQNEIIFYGATDDFHISPDLRKKPNVHFLCLSNIKEKATRKQLRKLINQADGIILHQGSIRLLLFLHQNRKWINKLRIVCWGGDLESLKSNKVEGCKTWARHILKKMLMKWSLQSAHSVGFLIDKDRDWVIEGTPHISNPKIVRYFLEKREDYDKYYTAEKPRNPYYIQLGNSAAPSNNHISVIEKMGAYKDEDFLLFVPLSYGGTKDYIDKVMSVGKDILSDKFVPVTDFMNYDEYRKFINKMTVSIQAQPRQQALGNINIIFQYGCKLYLNPKSPMTPHFLNRGFNIYSTDVIGKIGFKELISRNDVLVNRELLLAEDLSFDKEWENWIEFMTK